MATFREHPLPQRSYNIHIPWNEGHWVSLLIVELLEDANMEMIMARSMPCSRDDFPINAFVLLPPLPLHDSGVSRDHQAVTPASPDAVQPEISRADSDTSTLDFTHLKRSHDEMRSAIELIYERNGQLERENASLRRVHASLVETQQRVTEEAAKMEGKLRQQVKMLDQETLQLQDKVHAVERAKEREIAEKMELQAKVEEQETTIAELRDAMKEMENRSSVASVSAWQGADGEDRAESREKTRTASAAQTRREMALLHSLGEKIRKQLEHAEQELQSTEKDYETFRRFLGKQKHVGGSERRFGSNSHGDENRVESEDLRNRLQTLTEQNFEITTHNKVLLTKCTEYEKSVRLLNGRIKEFDSKLAAQASLLAKYEDSAADGTQTIADLQESLVKLCDQLSHERDSHQAHFQEQLRVAMEKESGQEEELAKLKDRLREMCQKLEDSKNVDRKGVAQCKSCRSVISGLDETSSPFPVDRMQSPRPSSNPNTKRSQRQQNQQLSSAIVEVDGDEIEDDDNTPLVPALQPDRCEGVPNNKRPVETKASSTCSLCNEEPFGFMVRCQKCKDPFHAGCVKNSATGTKKKLGHIFKCANCAPQRPTKVARVGGATSIPRTPSLQDENAAPAPTTDVVPRVISRPARQKSIN